MAGLDGKELTAALKMAKKKPRNFVFSAGSKLEQHFLELSKKKIPKGVIKDAKAATKSPKAFAGVCEFQDGVLVFKTKLSFGDMHSKALRQLVKKRAGLTSLTVELKQVDKLEEKDFEDEEKKDEAAKAGPAVKKDAEGDEPDLKKEAETGGGGGDADEGAMSAKEKEEALKEIKKIQKEMDQIMKTLKAKA